MLENSQLKTIAVIVVTGLFAYFLRLKNMADRVQTSLVKVSRNPSTNLDQTSLTVELKVTNPTDTSLNIEGVNGKLIYAGKVLGSYSAKKAFTILPKASVPLSLTFIANNQALISELVRLAVERKVYPVEIQYDLNTRFGTIPQKFVINTSDLI